MIRGRIPGLFTEHRLKLPQLGPLTELDVPQISFPVPGMHSGFNMELRGEEVTVHSFSRTAGGWSQTHLLTADSIKLIASERGRPRHRA